MSSSKEELIADLHEISELYEHLANLNMKTDNLFIEIINDGVESVKLIELRISEIFSLYNSVKVYLSVKSDLSHYEITSLLSFWNEAYLQIYVVAHDDINNKNISWLQDRFENYSSQYEIVENMLKSKIKELKELT